MKKNVVIIILLVVVMGLCGYVAYDKLLNQPKTEENDKTQEENDKTQEEKIEKKDVAYFKDYLYYFMPAASANNFLRNIDSFTEEDINKYIYFYYIVQVQQGKLNADAKTGDYDGTFTYTVSKDEVSKLVNKYFGIDNFELKEDWGERSGIRNLNDSTYQIYWFATGWTFPECELTSVVYNGKNVKVTGKIYDIKGTIFKENSEIIFNLFYNNGNYNLKSIKYSE